MTPLRAALAAFCSDHRVKLVHVWQTGRHWSAMVEWPYDPTARKALPTERHATGVGEDAVQATIAALDRIGYGGWHVRLFVLAYMMGMK